MEWVQICCLVLVSMALVMLFWWVCSNSYLKTASLACLGVVILTALLCFMMIKKEVVIEIDNHTVKIQNITYMCPDCNNYISGINIRYCSRCGRSLKDINPAKEHKK